MSVIVSIVPLVIGTIASAAISGITAGVLISEENQNKPVISLTTSIRNEKLLQQSLKNLGAKNIYTNVNELGSDVDNFHIRFIKNQQGVFDIHFYGKINNKDAEMFRKDLVKEYGTVAQNYVYETLRNKAEQKGLTLENEQIQADQSIVLTYNLK